jgi:gluconolactonase
MRYALKTLRIVPLVRFLGLVFFSAVAFVFAQPSLPRGGQLELVASGLLFTEGPVWKDSVGLFFSDINGNTIYRWSQQSGVVAVVKPSGNANGLTFDHQGRLLVAQQGARRVIRIERDSLQTILAERYTGKRLNSPNDLVVKSDGSIWFTDPPYGISTPQEELGFYGIFRISPSGQLQLLDKSLLRPNGIAFSGDEKKLYVNDSESRRIYIWDVVSDSIVANKQQFAYITPMGYADGMKVDSAGNIYCAGPLGVWIFSPGGAVLDTILVPGQTTNCNWGDADRKTLYITSGTAVYRIRLGTTLVAPSRDESGVLNRFRLYPNYPNPFNPYTTIIFETSRGGRVTLRVYDLLGRDVETLIDSYLPPGIHQTEFLPKNLSSGVYYYGLAMSHNSLLRKMMLVR